LIDGQLLGVEPAVRPQLNAVAAAIEPVEYAGRISEGSRILTVRVRLDVGEFSSGQLRNTRTTIATPLIVLSKSFEMLPADRPSVRTIIDPRYAESMRQPIRDAAVTFLPSFTGRGIGVTFACDPVPVGIAYDVSLWNGRYWHLLGTIACPPNTARAWAHELRRQRGRAGVAAVRAERRRRGALGGHAGDLGRRMAGHDQRACASHARDADDCGYVAVALADVCGPKIHCSRLK
jgi:hypothetical protein